MAQPTKIKLGKTTYTLKFGFGVNRRLSEIYKLPSYSAFGEFLAGLEFKDNAQDFTFDQLKFIGNLIWCGIAYYQNEDPQLSPDSIVDHILENPTGLEPVMIAFADSFPKEASQGKPKPQRVKKK